MCSLVDDPLTHTTTVLPPLLSCEDVWENQQAWSSALHHEGGLLVSPAHGKCAPNGRAEAHAHILATTNTTVAVPCQQMPARGALEAPQSDVAAGDVQEQTPLLVPKMPLIVDQRPVHQAVDLLPQTSGPSEAVASVSADIERPCIQLGHGVAGGGQATVCAGPTEADVAWWLAMVSHKASCTLLVEESMV